MQHFFREITQFHTSEQEKNTLEQLCMNCIRALSLPAESLCFFDIETTGLSPAVSSVYLLGVLVMENNKLMLHQWFADDYVSEQELLQTFSSFVTNKTTFVHYNGSTFDVPYLEKKYKAYKLPSPFLGKKQIDLYKVTKYFSEWFSMKNRKLTSMETLFGFQRHDRYTGKDCIDLYTEFMQKKFFRDDKKDSLRQKLLLHNEEDLKGTFLCSQLLLYKNPEILSVDFDIKEQRIILTGEVAGHYPVPLSIQKENCVIVLENSCIKLEISLYNGTLYHFFSDYKNYFYLPEEDTAVHKSVGIYVEPAFRQKATASNCYVKKEGDFLPLPFKFDLSSFSQLESLLFRESNRSKLFFIPVSECERIFDAMNICDFVMSYAYAAMTAPSPA